MPKRRHSSPDSDMDEDIRHYQRRLRKKLAKLEEKIRKRKHKRSRSSARSRTRSRARCPSPSSEPSWSSRSPSLDSQVAHGVGCHSRASPENSVAINPVVNSPEQYDDVLSISPGINLTELLGEEPSPSGGEFIINETVAKIWQKLIYNGLDKNARSTLLERFPRPKNCHLDAPSINPELKVSLGKSFLQKDDYYAALQSRLGTGISALAKLMDFSLTTEASEDLRGFLIPQINDVAKVLLDLFHSMSMQRRSLILPLLSRPCREIVKKENPSDLLFGPELGERLKAMETLQKSSRALLDNTGPMSFTRRSRQSRAPQGRQEHFRTNRSLPRRQGDRDWKSNSRSLTYNRR